METQSSNSSFPDILIVDDVPDNVQLLQAILSRYDYNIRFASSGKQALAALEVALPDVILLDIMMPEMDGYQFTEHLRSTPELRNIPVIFISALDKTSDVVKGFESGGVDYIAKPFKIQEVIARIENQLTLKRHREEIMGLNALKDQLIHTVSHDLKNPLNIILNYIRLLKVDRGLVEDEEQFTDIMEAMLRNANRMYDLITNLLDLTQIEAGVDLTMIPIEMPTFLSEIVEDFQPLAHQKNQTMTTTFAAPILTVEGDKTRLNQVFCNLLSNAIKYTPEGGEISVTSRVDAGDLIVSVSDNGIGIPLESRERVFDKFYRVNRIEHMRSKGTGLGLAIAKTIVEKHNGDIWVEDGASQGSTLTVKLPVTEVAN